jgi:hypothetical protein
MALRIPSPATERDGRHARPEAETGPAQPQPAPPQPERPRPAADRESADRESADREHVDREPTAREHTAQVAPAPDHEARTGTAVGSAFAADGDAGAEHTRVPEEPVTAKGLPKRTPKLTTPTHTPRQRTGSVDAEALRRRLGGFRQGAQAGYRDVEAEIAERTAQHQRPAPATSRTHGEEATGGTVEEASS